MYLYLIIMLYFFSISLVRGNGKIKKILTYIGGILLLLLLALKSSAVGNDTGNYIYYFNRLGQLDGLTDPASRFEVGYQVYSKLIYLIFKNSQFLFIISSIICMAALILFLKKFSNNIAYSLFLFVGLRFYYFYLSGIRQSLAISIILVAFIYFRNNKKMISFLLIILATLFHNSAIIFLLIFPLEKINKVKNGVAFICVFGLLSYLLINPLINIVLQHLPEYYGHYLLSESFAAGNLANYLDFGLKMSFIILAIVMNYKNLNVDNNDSNYKNNVYFMIISAILSLIATRASLLDRLELYFWIFSITFIPDILNNIRSKSNKKILTIFVTVFIFIYNIIILKFKPEWNMVVPYSFFWR